MGWLARLQNRLPRSGVRTFSRDLGWTSEFQCDGSKVHRGLFMAVGLRWQGYVHQKSGKLEFFIQNPPIQMIRDTEFSGCFHARNDGWWFIGFKPEALPADLDSGIAAVQHVLRTAFERRAEKRRSA